MAPLGYKSVRFHIDLNLPSQHMWVLKKVKLNFQFWIRLGACKDYNENPEFQSITLYGHIISIYHPVRCQEYDGCNDWMVDKQQEKQHCFYDGFLMHLEMTIGFSFKLLKHGMVLKRFD